MVVPTSLAAAGSHQGANSAPFCFALVPLRRTHPEKDRAKQRESG